ncbi:MAG TPA: hypothetical protein VN947_11520 [Polyangia bacterium]|nr:hypothetical protein [Polyangia bacterium]
MRAWIVVFALALGGCAGRAAVATDGGTPAHAITDDGQGHYTITLDRFTVAPGAERYACQDFANPFGGSDAAIHAFASHMTPGSHHLLVFYRPGAADDALADCSGTEFAPGPYGSQRPDDALSFPDGVAAVVAPSDGFRVQAHYLNATAAPLDVTVTITLTRIDSAAVTDRAAVLFFSNGSIDVPPGATGAVASKTCTLPFAVNLVQASGHMHQHGRDFTATAAGTTIFTSSVYSDVTPALFSPPLPLPAGTAITFACTYDNAGGTTPLVFGDSAVTDEMCIFSAQFYPAPFGGWTCL